MVYRSASLKRMYYTTLTWDHAGADINSVQSSLDYDLNIIHNCLSSTNLL